MKLKDGILVNKIDEDYVLIDIGIVKPVFNGMIKLNITGKEIIDLLKEDITLDNIISHFENKYKISKKEVENDIKPIIDTLKKNKLLIL